ncbi:MAG: hypothetical protein HOC20_09660 [Chloroflexi bacterium]|nr:hypothetical protein [Chloroflexota bacterium]
MSKILLVILGLFVASICLVSCDTDDESPRNIPRPLQTVSQPYYSKDEAIALVMEHIGEQISEGLSYRCQNNSVTNLKNVTASYDSATSAWNVSGIGVTKFPLIECKLKWRLYEKSGLIKP